MRLHVVGLPHTQTTHKYIHCAYSQKVVKFTKMMLAQGCEVILYSGEENDAECTEHVALLSEFEREMWYGPWDENGLFGNITWNPDDAPWKAMNERAVVEIRKRAEPRDVLCLVSGWPQKPIAEALPYLMPVEWAVGYEGIALDHRIFESYAWMHHVYGLRGIKDGHAYDAVVPNFFDPDDFCTAQHPHDYLLFVGRLVQRKGPHVAALIAERAGLPLLVAGPGATAVEPGRISTPEVEIVGPTVQYVGPVGRSERANLMAGAAALLAPTQYIEPFGGVAVEAMMCGTPVVASDWGAFTETVVPGVSGYRFRTLAEGVRAVDLARELRRDRVHEFAHANYSLDAVGPRFREHFERLDTLWDAGWYS